MSDSLQDRALELARVILRSYAVTFIVLVRSNPWMNKEVRPRIEHLRRQLEALQHERNTYS